MKGIKQFFKGKNWKRVLTATMAICVLTAFGSISASAAEPSAVDSSTIVDGVKSVTDSVTSNFSITTIASIVGVVLAACVGLFLFWWGSRKVVGMIMSAFKKGRISL